MVIDVHSTWSWSAKPSSCVHSAVVLFRDGDFYLCAIAVPACEVQSAIRQRLP